MSCDVIVAKARTDMHGTRLQRPFSVAGSQSPDLRILASEWVFRASSIASLSCAVLPAGGSGEISQVSGAGPRSGSPGLLYCLVQLSSAQLRTGRLRGGGPRACCRRPVVPRPVSRGQARTWTGAPCLGCRLFVSRSGRAVPRGESREALRPCRPVAGPYAQNVGALLAGASDRLRWPRRECRQLLPGAR